MAWFRRRKETRAITDVPWDVGPPLPGPLSQATALTLAPVYAANRHIADTVSTLPLQSYRNVGDRRIPMASLPVLFRLLADSGELGDWLYTCSTSLSLRGNAVGMIVERDGLGFPTVVHWVPMDEVFVEDHGPFPVWYWRGHQVDRSELVHVPWFKIPGRTLGLSPIEAYALTVTSGLEAQKFGTEWFQHGGVPPGTFKNTAQKVDQTEADIIKQRLVAAIRSRRPIVYGVDWEYTPIVIPPEQAQFIESMKVTANQVAAIYGIAPEEIGGEAANSLTYSTEEHRERRRLADLRPWLVRLETKFSSWLPERQYVRFNADAPIRTDLMNRYAAYKTSREIGLHNIDELRAFEDEAPLPNGQGQDYTPLGQAPAAGVPAGLVVPQGSNGDTAPSNNGSRL